jgi:DNA repair protein RecN (Recombination protein N)
MLGLKTLTAPDHPDKTLIFDEVDAGIGGRVATVVGEKLRGLGQTFQVLCITHLPQIAAAGDTHFAIEKQVRGSRTMTSVTKLDEASRIDEIGRMMGGADAGDQARASARELLDARRRTPAERQAKGESGRGRKRK